MRLQKKLTLTGTLVISALLSMPAGWADSLNSATVVEAKGDVFKRGFVDWNRELWQDPLPASKGDRLTEGMQLGTGNNSWAQLAWTNVTARAWANSVYAVAPNQRLVYLLGGEMLYHLDKHRKDKSAYYVWTKLVQARVRGTTILFQNTPDTTRITVLEGTVDVMNRIDKSVVRITPGVVYEVKDISGSAPVSTNSVSNLSNITINTANSVPLFQTAKTVTSLYALDPHATLGHPLIGSFNSPLSSLPLVQKSLGALIPKLDGIINGLTGTLNETLLSGAQVLQVPKALAYKVGPLVGSAFTLPRDAVGFFPPTGLIGAPSELQQTIGPFAQPQIVSKLMSSTGGLIAKANALPLTNSILPTKNLDLLSGNSVIGSGLSSLNTSALNGKTLVGNVMSTASGGSNLHSLLQSALPNTSGLSAGLAGLSSAAFSGVGQISSINITPVAGSALLPNAGQATLGSTAGGALAGGSGGGGLLGGGGGLLGGGGGGSTGGGGLLGGLLGGGGSGGGLLGGGLGGLFGH